MDSFFSAVRLSSASKRYQSAVQSRSEVRWDDYEDTLTGFEEFDADDDVREGYPCPFCLEYFDIVGLCCHIDDEHPVEAKNGVCPVCAMRVGVDMVSHITLHHGSIFKMQRKRKSRKSSSSQSTLSLLRELREGNLQRLLGGSNSRIVSSNNAAPDPLLSSFILPMVEDYETIPSCLTAELTVAKMSTTDNISERKTQQPPMSIKDLEEKTKRSDFVQVAFCSLRICEIYEGSENIKKNKLEIVMQKFNTLKMMKSNEFMDQLDNRVTKILNELSALDKIILDGEINDKILKGLSDAWNFKKIIKKDMGKIEKLSTNGFISELKAFEYEQVAEKLLGRLRS